jgi:hypothetical protein
LRFIVGLYGFGVGGVAEKRRKTEMSAAEALPNGVHGKGLGLNARTAGKRWKANEDFVLGLSAKN